ncbi:MAG TPA: GNAT family protein [Candidatus Dormibacteraeota bacterium]|nr:GNAT family protein [Candidatus Dormibacteraeota bacterium]
MSSQRLFHGDLIRLAAPRPEDAEVLSRWSEDGEYRRAMDTDAARPLPTEVFAERDQVSEASAGAYEFRVRTVQDDRLVGFVAIFSIEWPNSHGWIAVGIGDADDRGKGFGKEATSLGLGYAFHELGLRRLSLDVIADNLPAIALYRGLGFREEGRLRERLYRDGHTTDLIYMGLLRRDWESGIRPSSSRSEPGQD